MRSNRSWLGRLMVPATVICLVVGAARSALAQGDAGAPSRGDVDFRRDVRPILAKRCFSCHGPDEHARKANLRLDTFLGATADRNGEKAVLAGDPEKSLMWQRVVADDPIERMPPESAGPKLTFDETEVIRRWILAGAPWKEHWSFVAPMRPSPPETRNGEWTRRPMDAFVLAGLERAGLAPTPEADRRTLLRRVSLDLTGVPPTIAEVDAFAADPSPDAYERAVDRLLAQPTYGERFARVWLDIARFADTRGYEKDLRRTVWPFRDWLIRALNDDMTFDRFTERVLAGDLLPGATEDDQIATAFHRLTMANDEGGTEDEEFRIAAVKDRVDTTMQAWMGLTFGCAKCHSHKYEPISQEEYYRLFAFFDQTEDADLADDAPVLSYLSRDDRNENRKTNREIAAIEDAMSRSTPERAAAFSEWLDDQRGPDEWRRPKSVAAKSESGAKLTPRQDGALLVSGTLPDKDAYTIEYDSGEGRIAALRLEALLDPSLGPRRGPGRNERDPNFVVSEITFELVPADSEKPRRKLEILSADHDFAQTTWPITGAFDGDLTTGWAISPQFGRPHAAVFRLKEPVVTEPGDRLVVMIEQRFGASLCLGCFALAVSAKDGITLSALPFAVYLAAQKAENDRSAEDWRLLQEGWREEDPLFAADRAAIDALKSRLKTAVPLPIMKERPAHMSRTTRVHVRGNFLDLGREVQPGTPAFLPPMPHDLARNRLGLARWLTSRENPMTARVLVNRMWAVFFGRGIVLSEEDFGTQGTPPDNQDLLDYLAVRFADDWSMKRLCREIVLSATYRQGSEISTQAAAKDPENRLFSRGARVRLEAETIRDQALAVAGLLSKKMYGPSVMPPQPPGIWAVVYSADRWATSDGEDRFRRGIYTFMRRTSAYPMNVNFDGTAREVCTLRRIRSNTPLQALQTLNDPVFVEAAQALAARAMTEIAKETSADDPNVDRAIAQRIFRHALLRPPTEEETGALLDLFESRRAAYAGDAMSAAAMTRDALGEHSKMPDIVRHAAWTNVANVVLNLDEFLVKG